MAYNGNWLYNYTTNSGLNPNQSLRTFINDNFNYLGVAASGSFQFINERNEEIAGAGSFQAYDLANGVIDSESIYWYSSGVFSLKSRYGSCLIVKPPYYPNEQSSACHPYFADTPNYYIKVTKNAQTRFIPIYIEKTQRVGHIAWSDKTTLTQTQFKPLFNIYPVLNGNTFGRQLSATANLWFVYYDSSKIYPPQTDTEYFNTSFPLFCATPGTLTASFTHIDLPEHSTLNATTSWQITITDYDFDETTISQKSATNKVYAGKEIDNEFANNYKLINEKWCTPKNAGTTLTTTILSSLTKEEISPKAFNQNDTISFSYDYNGNTYNYVSSRQVIGLASGNEKFSLITYKSTYLKGETLRLSDINIRESGHLKYSDGTSISLADIEYLSEPTISCSLGSQDEYLIDETISNFTITYTLPTKHFGTLTFSYVASVNGYMEDYIASVVLKGAKTDFHAGEVLDFGSSAYFECYNADNELLEIIPYSNMQGNIAVFPNGYGSIIGSNMFNDSPITLNGKFRNYQDWSWSISVSWTEQALILDTTNALKTYYVNSVEDFELDTTDLIVKARVHNNNSISGSSISEEVISIDGCDIEYDSFILTNGNRVVPITISYENQYGQVMTKSYEVNVVIIEPQSIIVQGVDSTSYYDNDLSTFHIPTGLTLKVRYTDNSEVAINDFSSVEFYRDELLTQKLSIGSSIVKSNEGSKIYVKDIASGVSGYFNISFEEDTIISVYSVNPITIVLGNKLNKYKNSLLIKANRASGITTDITNFVFKDNGFIMASKDIVVIINGVEYTLDQNTITFVAPSIESVDLILNDFKTSYMNSGDEIDCSNIVAKVHYSGADYEQVCSLDGDNVLDETHFQVSSTNSELTDYVYNGSETINLTMGSDSELVVELRFNVKSVFGSETTYCVQNIKVFEILDITGISIVKTYGSYKVGERFLNSDDDTTIQVFYKDMNQNQRRFTTKLNSGLSVLNIFPTKNSILNSIGQKTIRITSSSNYNIVAEYSISVEANYIYDETKEHDIVAVKQELFTCPNGEILEEHYILIDRLDENGIPNTKTLSSGERVLEEHKHISDIKVYGYLEDIMNQSKNARVILFEDYIPPMDGQNNIEVTYPCYVNGSADQINKCHFGILFGNNNAKNRLFVSGNPNEANCDWHSGLVDTSNVSDEMLANGNFGYFEDTSWCYYGQSDNKIVGYDIVSNDKLLVLKDKSDKETSIYFRTPTLVAAIDGAGNQMTGLDGEQLYQEEFSLVKGNNSVAGISPKSIINFNGDTLFLSSDNQLVGLDLVGIIGDNQRYANSRSYFIDRDLKDKDLSQAILWSDNKYLFLCLKDKTYISHIDAKIDNQYEWWLIDIGDISVVLKIDEKIYFGNSKGEFYAFNDIYSDIKKVFVGQGGGILASEGEQDNTVITSQSVVNQLNDSKKYKFSIIANENDDSSYMYYSIGTISNIKSGDIDFYVNIGKNALEISCLRNSVPDYEEQLRLTSLIKENEVVYLNHIRGESAISCENGSDLATYYKKYKLKRYVPEDDYISGDLYNLLDENDNEIDISALYRAVLCCRLDKEYEITSINKANYSFKLQLDGKELDLVRYANQLYTRAFQAEIKLYTPVSAFYITKPYTLGDLNYFKTIWQYTLTNDTNIPSELELTFASNKIPYERTKTLAKISVDKFSLSLDEFNFSKVDFDKNVTPRTYTNSRILPRQKFICFGFKNYNDTNSVLSSMSIIYSLPHASFSGD